MSRAVKALYLGLGLGVCSLAGTRADQLPSAVERADIYARATNQFADAIFYKPAPATNSEITTDLAPLIIQQVQSDMPPASLLRDPFGTLSLANGILAFDQARPTIYWEADSVELNGQSHGRFTFLWCYSIEPRQNADALLPLQGVRITLNSRGQPAVWEVLADSSGAGLIFVSESLESAALAEFGNPLPGRRYAIERSVEQAPKSVVARVIPDGPVPMGPILYLTAGTHDVSTLICRCMPAQAKTLLATSAYELAPAAKITAGLRLIGSLWPRRSAPAFWPGDAPGGHRLQNCLRLPRTF